MPFLADINVWVALAFRSHQFHDVAAKWFMACGVRTCAFCRVTQQGFLRLATNQRVVGPGAATFDDAWRFFDAFMDDERVFYAAEPAGIEIEWRRLTHGARRSPNAWTDAYLAAFAIKGGFEIATFDRGFEQHNLVHCAILS